MKNKILRLSVFAIMGAMLIMQSTQLVNVSAVTTTLPQGGSPEAPADPISLGSVISSDVVDRTIWNKGIVIDDTTGLQKNVLRRGVEISTSRILSRNGIQISNVQTAFVGGPMSHQYDMPLNFGLEPFTGSNCGTIQIPFNDPNYRGTEYLCPDRIILSKGDINLQVQIYEQYVPFLRLRSSYWYDHAMTLKVGTTYSHEVSAKASLGVSAGDDAVSLGLGVSASVSMSHMTEITSTIRANGGETKYYYYQAYYIRYSGSVTFHQREYTNNGIVDGNPPEITIPVDFVQMLTFDLNKLKSTSSPIGDFPVVEGKEYRTIPNTPYPQSYDKDDFALTPGLNLATAKTTSVGFDLSMGLGGTIYKFIKGGLDLASAVSVSDTQHVQVEHSFIPRPGVAMPIKEFYLRIRNDVEVDIEFEGNPPSSYSDSSYSHKGFIICYYSYSQNICLESTTPTFYGGQTFQVRGYAKEDTTAFFPATGLSKIQAYISGYQSDPYYFKEISFTGGPESQSYSFTGSLSLHTPISSTVEYFNVYVKTFDLNGNWYIVHRAIRNSAYNPPDPPSDPPGGGGCGRGCYDNPL